MHEGSVRMNEQEPSSAFISALTTEHFVLQSAISGNTSEVGTRVCWLQQATPRVTPVAPGAQRAYHGSSRAAGHIAATRAGSYPVWSSTTPTDPCEAHMRFSIVPLLGLALAIGSWSW
jgi:hypothetical protein